MWIDATYVKVHQQGRSVSVAVIVAVGVNSDGRREVQSMDIGLSEAETFWTAFLPSFDYHAGLLANKFLSLRFGLRVSSSSRLGIVKGPVRRVASQGEHASKCRASRF